jgi:hypothetical protein
MLAPALAFYRNAFGHPWIWRTDTDAGSEFIAYVIHRVRTGPPIRRSPHQLTADVARFRIPAAREQEPAKPRRRRYYRGCAEGPHPASEMLATVNASLFAKAEATLVQARMGPPVGPRLTRTIQTLSAQSFTCDMRVIGVQ